MIAPRNLTTSGCRAGARTRSRANSCFDQTLTPNRQDAQYRAGVLWPLSCRSRRLLAMSAHFGDPTAMFASQGAAHTFGDRANNAKANNKTDSHFIGQLALARRMVSSALRQDKHQCDYGDCQHGGRDWAAHCETAVIERLIEEVADGGTKRARQDEGRPE